MLHDISKTHRQLLNIVLKILRVSIFKMSIRKNFIFNVKNTGQFLLLNCI